MSLKTSFDPSHMFENSNILRRLSKWTTTWPSLERRLRGWESLVPGGVAGETVVLMSTMMIMTTTTASLAVINFVMIRLIAQVLDLVDDGPSGVDLHHDGYDNEAVSQEASAPSSI